MNDSYVLYSKSKNQVLLNDMKLAATYWERMRGLMGQQLSESEGLMIKPCNSIHSSFMRIAIDVLFLDVDMRVMRKIETLS